MSFPSPSPNGSMRAQQYFSATDNLTILEETEARIPKMLLQRIEMAASR